MHKPNAQKHHRPRDSDYLANLISESGLRQQDVADAIGVALRSVSRHCNPNDTQNCNNGGPEITYPFQHAIECLTKKDKTMIPPIPDGFTQYRPDDTDYLRELIKRSGLTQAQCAVRLGLNVDNFQKALRRGKGYRVLPYTVQFSLECLAQKNG